MYIILAELLGFMTVVLAATSVVNIVSVILLVIIYDRAGVDGTADVLVPYASDLLTFSNAYLLIILNKKIRQRVLRYLKCCGKVTIYWFKNSIHSK
ncbi:hypothetical protein OSTOST_24691, partial [Ostertagia ostertagi]